MRPIYYDTETTGINPATDRIVEIAAYDPVRGKTFNRLVHPQCPIPPSASAIHTITDEMVADAPPFSVIGLEFVQFCESDVVLIAHNNDAFDGILLLAEAKRHQVQLPPFPMLDSLKWARKYRSDLPRHSLQFLRQVYAISENKAHRALDDVMVLYEVFSAMTGDLPITTVMGLLGITTSKPLTV